ncbi:MAG: lamin tail domain-containing protein [Verrucomicrobiales bacterium]
MRLTRPVGIGSLAATAQNPGNHFNLGSDPSIRKDNGSVTGHSQAVPMGVPFIRRARMDGSGVKEWFSEDGAATVALDSAGTGFTTSSDRLYLGDIRCGASPVPDFGAGTAPSDFDIIEVLVYTAALSDAQILGINEWLAAHVAGEPPPLIRSFSADPQLIASGESAALSWEVERATAVSISPAVGAVALAGGASVSPDASTTYTLTATGDGGTASAQVFLGVDIDPVPPAITEFAAANAAGLEDEDGDSSDWVEIHNPNAFALEVGGYSLTDDPNNPIKWQIPAGQSIAPGGYLVVFASGKDRSAAEAELHASFSLDQAGEFLALVAPDGSTVVSAFDPGFPDQIADVAYGIDEGGAIRFLAPPTPGAANGAGFDGRVADTKFSVDRGFLRYAAESRSPARRPARRSATR